MSSREITLLIKLFIQNHQWKPKPPDYDRNGNVKNADAGQYVGRDIAVAQHDKLKTLVGNPVFRAYLDVFIATFRKASAEMGLSHGMPIEDIAPIPQAVIDNVYRPITAIERNSLGNNVLTTHPREYVDRVAEAEAIEMAYLNHQAAVVVAAVPVVAAPVAVVSQ